MNLQDQRIYQKNSATLRRNMQPLVAFVCGVVCLSAVSAVPASDERQQEIIGNMKKCVAESGVEKAILDIPASEGRPEDPKLDCYQACMLQNFGLMDKDGVFDKEKALAKIPEDMPKDVMTAAINACASEKGANACETAGLIFKCFHKEKVDNYVTRRRPS